MKMTSNYAISFSDFAVATTVLMALPVPLLLAALRSEERLRQSYIITVAR